MVEYYIMKKEICWTFHAKCGTRDLTKFSGLSRERRDGWSPILEFVGSHIGTCSISSYYRTCNNRCHIGTYSISSYYRTCNNRCHIGTCSISSYYRTCNNRCLPTCTLRCVTSLTKVSVQNGMVAGYKRIDPTKFTLPQPDLFVCMCVRGFIKDLCTPNTLHRLQMFSWTPRRTGWGAMIKLPALFQGFFFLQIFNNIQQIDPVYVQ
jgi:hypothetical protein